MLGLIKESGKVVKDVKNIENACSGTKSISGALPTCLSRAYVIGYTVSALIIMSSTVFL